ncbi:hypothetical protein BH10BAC2_BH10BAC2_40950 [soil metagenome]
MKKMNCGVFLIAIIFSSCQKDQVSPAIAGNAIAQSEDAVASITIVKPLAKWKLNELKGKNAIDVVGNFDGVYKGGVTPGAGMPFLDGTPSAAFDGKSGFVELPPSSTISPSLREVTVEAWVYLRAINGFQAIVSPPDHGSVHFQTGYGNNVVYTSINPPVGVNLPIFSGNDLLGKWHYVAMVGDPGDSRVYLDGVRYGSNNTQKYDSVAQSPSNLRIGGGFDYSRFWTGSIRNVAIYNVALTDKQILAHYRSVHCKK